MKTFRPWALGLLACALLALSATAQANSAIYSGSLSSDNGLTGEDEWTSGISLSWEIFYDEPSANWTYEYTLAGASGKGVPGISHFNLEVSSGNNPFTAANIKGPFDDGHGTLLDPDTLGDEGGSSPGIPGTFWAVKWDEVGDIPTGLFRIVTNRAPTWGDFYAKGGQSGVWNTGFVAGELGDPLDPAADGPHIGGDGLYHLLVPDSLEIPPPPPPPGEQVPEPLTALAFVGAAGFVGRYIRRR